ncbi:MAG TPA: phosphate ABC transporter substrate-binding protein [Planctomycetota bacterium]|nr:phosphate ABC transporter substrate-binding protein [Planctomycetota bacterium]
MAALVLGAAATGLAQQVKLDGALPPYEAVSGVSGNLSSVGSDTMNNLMTLWAEQFRRFYPNVNIQVEGKGSSTAIPALVAGTAQLGPMSRPPKDTEIDLFESKFGYKPLVLRTAVDALAVFVNKDNPLPYLTLEQADAIFSKSRRRGGRPVRTWGDLGLTGEWAGRPISLYGRNSASGTYGFFKEHVLKNGDFKDEVKEQPGSASVVLGVATDPTAIGYSGIGYVTSGVRAVPLVDRPGGAPIAATAENAYSGEYPLARFLLVVVNRPPSRPLDPLTREFLKLVFSRPGQEVVLKDGYFPLTADLAREERSKIE